MATQNDFLPFATGPGANVVDQATYAALGALTTGFLSGTAQSMQLNKVWRQSSIMAAVIAQFIVAQTGQAAVDDGTTATLLANFTKAVNAASKQRVILPDSGSVNAYAAANPVPMTSLPTVSGIVQTISVKTTNTGASTYSPDGLPSRPSYGLGGGALQGGELVANGIATLASYVGPLLNGGSLCWVLFECIGGAQQVAPATQSQHAVQVAQLFGGLKGIARWTGAGTYSWTVPANVTTVYASGAAPGGGGGAGGSGTVASSPAIAGGGGGGGAGQSIIRQAYTVVPGSTVTITIGAPGSGGTAVTTGSGSPGGTAGNLVISGSGFNGGTSVTLTGGGGGGGGSAVQTSSGGAATGGGAGGGFPAGSYGNDTSAGYASGSGGAGASGPFGGGGGAARTSTAGSLAGGNAYGYGAGGGSGVYSSNAGNGGAGGNGAPGIMTFEW
ncbi:hypothetical protein [Burkholderia multivorans]|uniref:glycine-rich domain-containing protein n=1 Tax=Burkholderia multivorans TaxID=87883 RepID=UPI000B1B108B|nr:hypothetical protein [Burkholderia multivorans]MDN7760111.1 hypothetical protein [Burkholderia multivorans]MDN8100298.1 hypothetical protein [Burkholderia multivorans]